MGYILNFLKPQRYKSRAARVQWRPGDNRVRPVQKNHLKNQFRDRFKKPEGKRKGAINILEFWDRKMPPKFYQNEAELSRVRRRVVYAGACGRQRPATFILLLVLIIGVEINSKYQVKYFT